MDFQEILSQADCNIADTKYTGNVKRYSSVLPPPKKVPKANVQSENIKKFLEKKKAEEAAKVAEALKQKEQLLALRAQNSKNNKKAKIMASRTKDNDFSRIKLTDDEIEAKKKREEELLRKNLADKVERMKARIEMEEKEKLLPKKRKRKSKNAEPVENLEEYPDEVQNEYKRLDVDARGCDSNMHRKNNTNKPKPPQPTVSFTDLLKIAEKKQFQPMDIVAKKKEEEKLLTKKERKLREEEIARERRKQERERERLMNESRRSSKPNCGQSSSINKKGISEKVASKNPVVIHVGKDVPKMESDGTKFKTPKGTTHSSTNKNGPVRYKDTNSDLSSKHTSSSISTGKSSKTPVMTEKKNKLRNESSSPCKDAEIRQKMAVPKKNGVKINSVPATSAKSPKFDEKALKASIETELREKIEKEIAEKVNAQVAAQVAQLLQANKKLNEKVAEVPKQIRKEPVVGNNTVKKGVVNPVMRSEKDIERMVAMKKQAMAQKNLKPKLPEKKPFHMNPYLDPPRRLLEPQRPPRPPKRCIESDYEDSDDDDDLSDFIDDGPSVADENYSDIIKEIFKYDKSKYIDDEDDDIMESTFAEQMKEEVRSARLGLLEDLEEERLELERKRKKKLKK